MRSFVNRKSLKPPQLPLDDASRLRRHQIPQRVRRIIAAVPVLVRIHFKNVLRPVWIVLERRFMCGHYTITSTIVAVPLPARL